MMYNFDNVAALGETTGGIIKDASLYGNHAAANGVTYASNGRYNGAYNFNGTEGIIQTNVTTQFRDFTVSVRFKDDQVASSYERLVDKNYAGGFRIGRNSSMNDSW